MKKDTEDSPEQDRLSHAEYRQVVRQRGIADRVIGALVLASGMTAVISVILAVTLTEVGSYTGHQITDLIVFGFIFCSGVYFTQKGFFMIRVFLCRFCLFRIPEGSTYCPSCRADLLSNENPHKT